MSEGASILALLDSRSVSASRHWFASHLLGGVGPKLAKPLARTGPTPLRLFDRDVEHSRFPGLFAAATHERMRLNAEVERVMCAHAEATAPEECVGALLGDDEAVHAVLALQNSAVNRATQFEISARDYLLAEREAERRGLRLLGFFHSHVDAPAVPSAKDLEHVAQFELGLIISVTRGKAAPPVVFHSRA